MHPEESFPPTRDRSLGWLQRCNQSWRRILLLSCLIDRRTRQKLVRLLGLPICEHWPQRRRVPQGGLRRVATVRGLQVVFMVAREPD